LELKKLFVLRKSYLGNPIKNIQKRIVDIIDYKLYDQMSVEEVESAVNQVTVTEKFKQSILNKDLTDFLEEGNNNLTNGLDLPFPILTEVFKGIRKGETMAYAMPSNSGKSRFAINIAAYTAGQPVQHIFTFGLFYGILCVSGSGLTLGLNILMMRSKAKSLNSVGKVSIIPGLFGINEPLIFGTPIILNPFMFIPFVFGPLICTTIVYLTMNLGLVGKPIANPPGFLPPGVSAFLMTLDWKSVVLVFVLLILQTVFYYPFFKMMEKEELQKEQALEK
jgi:lactose/cellobiose-specific phosphotransferase system IIC component